MNTPLKVTKAGTNSVYNLDLPLYANVPIDLTFAGATPPSGGWFGVFLVLDDILKPK